MLHLTSLIGPETYIIIIECSRIDVYIPFHHIPSMKVQFTDNVGTCAIIMMVQTSVFSSSLQTVLCNIASCISQSTFFWLLYLWNSLPSWFQQSIICLSASKTVLSNFSIKLATDSVIQSCVIPSCNKLVVSKSISHTKGSKLRTEHCSFQQSALPPVSYSAPYSCTLPGCVPAV